MKEQLKYEVYEWLVKAENHLIRAIEIDEKFNNPNKDKWRYPCDDVAYFSALAVEETLKAYLYSVEDDKVSEQKSHDTNWLIRGCMKYNPQFAADLDLRICSKMKVYVSNLKYPNSLELTMDDSKLALKFANRVWEADAIFVLKNSIKYKVYDDELNKRQLELLNTIGTHSINIDDYAASYDIKIELAKKEIETLTHKDYLKEIVKDNSLFYRRKIQEQI